MKTHEQVMGQTYKIKNMSITGEQTKTKYWKYTQTLNTHKKAILNMPPVGHI